MPNRLSIAWVKNVYSLCVLGMQSRAQSYTGKGIARNEASDIVVQPTSFTHFMDTSPPTEYTAKIDVSYLLPTHLYTVSTPPIINENKEKIRKDS